MVFRILHDLCVPNVSSQTAVAKRSHTMYSRDRKHTYVAKTQQIFDPAEDGTLSASISPLANPPLRLENFHCSLELACGSKRRRNVTLSRPLEDLLLQHTMKGGSLKFSSGQILGG